MEKKEIARRISTILTAAVFFAAAVPVSASEQQTTLNLVIPSTYTMTIPKSQHIEYGKNETQIGTLTVEGNIRPDEALYVSVKKSAFQNLEKKHSFAFRLLSGSEEFSGRSWSGMELETEQTVPLSVSIADTVWDEVQAGNYTAALTFTAEIQQQ